MNRTQSWIALDLLPNIGPKTVRRLLQAFGNPESLFTASAAEISRLGFLTRVQTDAILAGPDEKRVQEIIDALDSTGSEAVCLDDSGYPDILREIDDPPSVLYVKGSLDDLQPAVAIVGMRSPSLYGKETAFRIARDLSAQGISVISGLARGIDGEAHRGALEGIAGTVAVLGSGIDIIYPPEHAELAGRIGARGAVVSEFPPGTRPEAKNFPRRNRIISGLAQAVIVVEATLKSGAMITARYALDQGRMIMAVPGNVTNIRSQGPHHLISQGALLVGNAQDVLAEIAPQVTGIIRQLKQTTERSDDILTMASGSPVSIDEVAQHLDINVTEASRRVSMLELSGSLERVAGNRYITRSIHG
ncbi:MAG TPA: DNA-processing protein DprA [Deltaproteobacteria bacterium]|nr:DNA-processing protein DprA [Deltaproteobacteria bacterium]HPR56310.1 DNA-processing protein DprA [Deltaproteobacteria bacterium]HXK46466.1 DNA-processing protein DprA [Deltaproteobacteria bacterium]